MSIDTVFALVRQHSIYRKTADWDKLYRQFKSYTDTAKNPFQGFRWLFGQLSDHHSSVRHRGKRYQNSSPTPVGREDVCRYLRKQERYNSVRIKRFGDYGYIAIPSVGGDDSDIRQFVQAFRDSICRVFKPDVKGWIVDVRANGGGNLFPMMAVLEFLLPDGVFGTVRGADNELISQWSLQNGDAYQNGKPETTNGRSCLKKDLSAPVVLLTSPVTVSSGEMVVMAFRGRKNTVVIGDTTGGLVTSNDWMDLSENTVLNISNGYVADRFGNLYKTALVPDIVLAEGYNFENLNQDAHIRQAIQWLDAHRKRK
ncbi:MAG: S41 family peptidase [Cytophagales bacterium]|nr:S41 family peptidase [Cytophagales bacterium]